MEKQSVSNATQKNGGTAAKFLLLSFIGIFMFFIPITINEARSIPIDHIVTYIRSIPHFGPIYGTAIVILGAILPFIRKTWKKRTQKNIRTPGVWPCG